MIILDAEEKKKKAESKKQKVKTEGKKKEMNKEREWEKRKSFFSSFLKKYTKKRDTGKRLLPTGGLPIR